MNNLCRVALIFSMLTTSLPLLSMPPLIVDGDGDGVSDERDDCPYSRLGSQVNSSGCAIGSLDGDTDGVEDDSDECPYTPPNAWVDSQGCALDRDLDGVADGIDVCPNTGLNAKVDLRGCAVGQTASLALAANRKVMQKPETGAPKNPTSEVKPSSAGDVVKKNTVTPAPLKKTESQTQVTDNKARAKQPEPSIKPSDVEPTPKTLSDLVEPTPATSTAVIPAENTPVKPAPESLKPSKPSAKKTPVSGDWREEPLFRTIFFGPASSEITDFSLEKLTRALPELVLRLKSHPKLRVEVIGHAAKDEQVSDTSVLADDRAKLVAAYLAVQGIPREAIHAAGKGTNNPRASQGDTSVNRRVEILTYAE